MTKEWEVTEKMPTSEARIIAAIITAGQLIGKDLADATAVAKYQKILDNLLSNEFYAEERRKNENLQNMIKAGEAIET